MSQASPPLSVLVVDDDAAILRTLILGLKGFGYEVTGTDSPEAALETIKATPVDILLTDMRMDGMTGVELIKQVLAHKPQCLCVVMTAFASYENAVSAIKAGAFDYLPKPFSIEQLEHLMAKLTTLVTLQRENARLKLAARPWRMEGLSSPAGLAIESLVERIAPTEATVLVTGETGTGKTELARTIHRLSPRSNSPFVEVTCTSLAETLFESEVFGHVKGAFTGAIKDHVGKFELAAGGTLFLDEIGDLSPLAQAKLLRFLEDRVIERVGDSKMLHLDVRIIAATNHDLAKLVHERRFREDLLYRLNIFEITLPPLRERREDIAPLAAGFLRAFRTRHGIANDTAIPGPFLDVLLAHDWPGNLRELRNVMERVALLASGRPLDPSDLPREMTQRHSTAATGSAPMRKSKDKQIATLAEVEEEHIRAVLSLGLGLEQAASALGITTVTLWRKRKEYGLL